MRIEKLKETIASYQELLDRPTDDNYVSLIAVEEVLKKKQLELQEKLREFERYVSIILNNKCTVKIDLGYTFLIRIYYNNALFSKSDEPNNCYSISVYGEEWSFFNPQKPSDTSHHNINCRMLDNDKRVNDFLNYCIAWNKKYTLGEKLSLLTNLGLYVDFNYEANYYKMNISDSMNEFAHRNLPNGFVISRPTMFGIDWRGVQLNEDDLTINFYYFKDMLNNQRELKFKNDETKDIINETILADIYSKIKVDVSSFPKELQDEMKTFETYYRLKLHERADSEKTSLKVMQTKRIMEAYQMFKKATELLNNLKMEDISLDKIHMDDLENIFFKNNGRQNEQGYIEINEMFKDNMLLRMLDLSGIDFTNVDIRGMDFSGTNANIHPQLIYNKDMTNVNATGIEFSPFKPEDRFDDVVLDGAIIDSYNAMIDLDTVRSYNNQTIIPAKRTKK